MRYAGVHSKSKRNPNLAAPSEIRDRTRHQEPSAEGYEENNAREEVMSDNVDESPYAPEVVISSESAAIYNRSIQQLGEAPPPPQPELTLRITDFLLTLDNRYNTNLSSFANRLESRGWGIEDLENVPRNLLDELDMSDEEIDLLIACAVSYLIGRQHGHTGTHSK